MNVEKQLKELERKVAKCPKFHAHWRTPEGELVTKEFFTVDELRTFCDELPLSANRCYSVRHSGDVQVGLTVSFFGNIRDADSYAKHLREKHKTFSVLVFNESKKKLIGDFSQRD